MIIAKLIGGLGNQMFQYSLGRSLSLKNNDEFKLDVTIYSESQSGITPRQYALDIFNIVEKIAGKEEINNLKTGNKFFRKIGFVKKTHYLEKRIGMYDERIMKIAGSAYLEGFWQTEKYFKDIREILLNDFSLRDKMCEKAEDFLIKIKSENSASIHIRRADYINKPETNDFHGTCSVDYYGRAMDFFKNKNQNVVFFVFSDDIAWAKENLKGNNLIFVSSPEIKDYEELVLMSKCEHNIVANSSFSWWGAWLNKNFDKIIVAPKKWFKSEKADNNDIILKDWIKL